MIIVAIDGFSSCGKSTIAKELARYAGYTYVDTGAMYRAVALYCLRNGWITPDSIDEESIAQHLDDLSIEFRLQSDGTQHIYLNGVDEESEIRTLEVANGASRVSTLGTVRSELVRQQQLMGLRKGIVMDGRDIGTVVFPQAELKLFLTALPEIRAQRRFDELVAKGDTTSTLQEVLDNVKERDYRDTHRDESPLRQADDAVLVDNSTMTRTEQMEHIKRIFDEKNK